MDADISGIELLSKIREHHPGAMRALMIDVGDLRAEEPIIRALTLNDIDYYFGKPWASPEEELYPTTGEALRVWSSAHLPRLEKIKFIDDSRSPLIRSLLRGCELNNVAIRFGLSPLYLAHGSAHAHRLLVPA